MLKPGWLTRQKEKVEKDIKTWPQWMQKAAGFGDVYDTSPKERKAPPEKRA